MKIAVNGRTGRMGVAVLKCIEKDTGFQLVALTEQPDVIVDFSRPPSTMSLLPLAMEHKIPLIIGTTGFSGAELVRINATAEKTAVVLSPNMSIGINVCLKTVEHMMAWLGGTVQVAISEIHHKDKVDAPSGTALKLGEAIKGAGYANDIQYTSLRLGDVAGDHTVTFAAEGERIELTHRASNRMNFARGALRAARWAVQKNTPGLYNMQQVLGLV